MNIEALKAAGFKPVTYPGQDGTYYAKTLLVLDMPYMKEHAIDNEVIFEDTQLIVEVTPDARVQMTAVNTSYVEDPIGIDTEEGRALLRDAGFDPGA